MAQRLPAPGTEGVRQALGIAGLLIQAALLVGCLFLLVGRWQMPVGSLTLILLLNSFLLSVLTEQYALIPAWCFTGLVADLLGWQLKPSVGQRGRLALFAGGVPMLWSGLYFLTLSLAKGIIWTLPLWTGSILLAGLAGLGLSFVLRSGR